MMIQLDFLGNPIYPGDKCIYMKNTRTGSSTVRRMLYKGIAKSFTKVMVVMENGDMVPAEEVVKMDWKDEDERK